MKEIETSPPDASAQSKAPPPRLFRESEKLKVGCIGAGDIVRATHLPVLAAVDGVNVDWVMDVDEKRAAQMARVYGTTYRPMPANPRELPFADIYLLTCPFGVREPYYEALSGKDHALYVEKPLSHSPGHHRKLCRMFPDYALTSGLMMRCWGPNLLVKRVIEERLFGQLIEVRFGFGRPGLVTQNRFYFDRNRGGAGLMAEVGIHGVDSALFVSGAIDAKIVEVDCIFDGDLDLHTEAHLNLTNVLGQDFGLRITVSCLQDTTEKLEFEFENATLSYPLPGQGYALIAEQVDMNVMLRAQGANSSYKFQPFAYGLYPFTKFQMFHENWTRFVAGVRAQKANSTCGIQSLLTTEVLHACAEAGRSKKV